MANFLGGIGLGDGNKTDNVAMHFNVFMIEARVSINPPSDILEVRANFDYCITIFLNNLVYAMSDGRADSCIIGWHAHVISYTGRYANLIGYDIETSKKQNFCCLCNA